MVDRFNPPTAAQQVNTKNNLLISEPQSDLQNCRDEQETCQIPQTQQRKPTHMSKRQSLSFFEPESGFMHKYSPAVLKGFQRRFVILDCNQLKYYKQRPEYS